MQRQFLLDRVCCTGLPIYQYAAQGLQICSAQSLQIYFAQNQIKQECDAQRLHICSAEGLQICFAPCLKMCCVHNPQMPTQMLHMVCKHNLREFVKTHVILAPLREFSRSRAASKIPFPGAQAGQAGKAGEPEIFHFRCKNRYLRSRVI